MAKPRGRGHGDAEGTGRPSRGRGSAGVESVADAQVRTEAAAHAGRPSSAGGSPRSDLVTHPTGQRGGEPEGPVTKIEAGDDATTKRSLERENVAAAILADHGYRTQQNPTKAEVAEVRSATGDTGDPAKDPDYVLDGRIFDCYSPEPMKPVRGIWSVVEDKVVEGQTQRVVVDLEHWPGSLTDLRKQFDDWPIEHLKEVKIITSDGEVVQFMPNPENG